MNCYRSCSTCKNFIATVSLTVTDGQLVVQLPDQVYTNNRTYCIYINQEIPAGADATTPVVYQIGTAATLYPLRTRNGHNVYADQLKRRRIYKSRVASDSGTFVFVGDCLYCTNHTFPAGLPV